MSNRELARLSAILVTYNSRRTLPACLDALRKFPPGVPWDLWIVDNASADGTAAWVAETQPDARLIRNDWNAGFGAANNQALRATAAPFVLLLNPDTQVREGAVGHLLEFLDAHPRAAAAGPRIVHPDGSLQRTAYTFPTVWQLFFDNFFLADLWPNNPVTGPFKRWRHDMTRPVPWLVGACLLARREALLEVGGFDERFFLFAEETDLCRRLWKAGWETHFLADAEVLHEEKASFNETTESAERVYEGIRRYFTKHGGPGAVVAVHGIQLAGAAIRLSLLLPLLPFSNRFRERWTYYLRKTAWYLGLRRRVRPIGSEKRS